MYASAYFVFNILVFRECLTLLIIQKTQYSKVKCNTPGINL